MVDWIANGDARGEISGCFLVGTSSKLLQCSNPTTICNVLNVMVVVNATLPIQ